MMILGLVSWMQPVHGYDVRRELLSWSADKWANVQPGSIYHALRKLADEGLLREVATVGDLADAVVWQGLVIMAVRAAAAVVWAARLFARSVR